MIFRGEEILRLEEAPRKFTRQVHVRFQADAMDAARLEALARERGMAVGMATASPASVDRIAQWTKALEGRGMSLVPVTAITIKPKSS